MREKDAYNNVSQEDESLHIPKLRLITEGILLDFLGGLVPGILFILAAVFALMIPTLELLSALSGQPGKSWNERILEYASNIKQTPSAFWIAVFVTFSLVAFVIGHLFYRNDPKKPDQRSFKKISKGKSVKQCQEEFGAGNGEDCEFPYKNYHTYLESRGIKHLLHLAVWCSEEGKEPDAKRSKNFINIFKIRLRYYFPDKCSILIWNEAHIRLAASGWYVANVLLGTSFLGLIIAGISFRFNITANNGTLTVIQLVGRSAISFLAPLSILSFSVFLRLQVEHFLHYQRLREVFFVLETTFTAFREKYELLSPPLSKNAVEALNSYWLPSGRNKN